MKTFKSQTQSKSAQVWPVTSVTRAKSTVPLNNTDTHQRLPEAPCPGDSLRRAAAAGRGAPGSFVQSLFSFWLYKFHYPADTPWHRELWKEGQRKKVKKVMPFSLEVNPTNILQSAVGKGSGFPSQCYDALHLHPVNTPIHLTHAQRGAVNHLFCLWVTCSVAGLYKSAYSAIAAKCYSVLKTTKCT